MHLLAIRPPFLYCKLFCRQDGGIVTPPSLRPSTKNNTLLVERAKLWRGMSKCGRLGRCVLAATLFDHYRASLHVYERSVGFASLPRQPLVPLRSFVPLHLCIDSHLCRCIVQRLCVAVFMHPCITALCGCLYASLHND